MSKKPVIKFKKLNPEAIIPHYAHADDAAFDLYSTEETVLWPGRRYVFKLGIASEFSNGWYVSIRGKSGLALKYGIDVLAGVIDAGYRGEWGVVLVNLGEQPMNVEKGDKIAQASLLPLPDQAVIKEVEEISDSERGKGGFGSTGRK
ncbi:MAG: dUTP diphosphatase [bacterium]|nr:dUTP diphosphatase [bacterium]